MTQEKYQPKFVKILQKTQQTADQILFRIAFKAKHDPGQFMQLSALGIGEAPISICSHSKDYIELNVRNVGNVTNAISQLNVGDKMGVRGPYGTGYHMKDFQDKNVIIIGGGCGVAPLRGIIKSIEKERKMYKDVYLWFGYRNTNEILFKTEMKKWAKSFHTDVTIDKPEKGWAGRVGVVTKIIEEARIDSDSTVAVICGPPIMIKFCIQSLAAKGLQDKHIYISHERHMKCGVGKCGHCMIHGKCVCKDGPVFRYDTIKEAVE